MEGWQLDAKLRGDPYIERHYQGLYSVDDNWVLPWHLPATLVDFGGEALQGSFYEQELQVVKPPTYYDVEAVLRTRNRGGRREFLVKWAGYPDSFNSWETDIIGLT